jgi:hypothetical protein
MKPFDWKSLSLSYIFIESGLVLAAKVFNIRNECDLDTIASKLKDYRMDGEFLYEDHKIPLLTEIKDLARLAESVQGIFSQDEVSNIYHRGRIIPTPKTIEAPIFFTRSREKIILIVLEKKQRANNIANLLSKILFITAGHIVEARIGADTLKRFHEENYEDTKIIFFDGVDVPNIDKLSIYGSALANTSTYTDYLTHGNIWYIVVKSKKYGYILGLTRNSVVTVFSHIEKQEFLSYITNEVLPLIS